MFFSSWIGKIWTPIVDWFPQLEDLLSVKPLSGVFDSKDKPFGNKSTAKGGHGEIECSHAFFNFPRNVLRKL